MPESLLLFAIQTRYFCLLHHTISASLQTATISCSVIAHLTMNYPYTKRHLTFKQLGQEARVTFKEWVLDSGDIKDIDNGHEEDMTEEDIEIVDEAFRECLQVLDVVLATPRNGSAFNAYFKDHRYYNSIFGACIRGSA